MRAGQTASRVCRAALRKSGFSNHIITLGIHRLLLNPGNGNGRETGKTHILAPEKHGAQPTTTKDSKDKLHSLVLWC